MALQKLHTQGALQDADEDPVVAEITGTRTQSDHSIFIFAIWKNVTGQKNKMLRPYRLLYSTGNACFCVVAICPVKDKSGSAFFI